MSLQVKIYPNGPLHENTYLVIDEASGLKAVIDPGYFGEDVAADIEDINTLKYIILTHGHFDHVYAVEDYQREYQGSKIIAPEKDKYIVHKNWADDILTRGMKMRKCPEPDEYVVDNETLTLGDTVFTFIDTPGHTEGGMCILADDMVFCGDTLFRLSVGNTTLETGSWDDLVTSIKTRLYTLDDETTVYPGHGPKTTIGYEKRNNPFV